MTKNIKYLTAMQQNVISEALKDLADLEAMKKAPELIHAVARVSVNTEYLIDLIVNLSCSIPDFYLPMDENFNPIGIFRDKKDMIIHFEREALSNTESPLEDPNILYWDHIEYKNGHLSASNSREEIFDSVDVVLKDFWIDELGKEEYLASFGDIRDRDEV